MLAPLVLPAQITIVVLLACLVMAIGFARVRKQAMLTTLIYGTILSGILFVPTCTGIMSIADGFRLGSFTYSDFQAVTDRRVQNNLPSRAANITVSKLNHLGHRAKFQITRESLEDWNKQSWTAYGKQLDHGNDKYGVRAVVKRDDFAYRFSGLSWPLPETAITVFGPVAQNGAGYRIWFDESEQIAYQTVAYW